MEYLLKGIMLVPMWGVVAVIRSKSPFVRMLTFVLGVAITAIVMMS